MKPKRIAAFLMLRDGAHRRKVLLIAGALFFVLAGMGLASQLSSEVAILAGLAWLLFLLSVLVDALSGREEELVAIRAAIDERDKDGGGLVRIYSHVGEVSWSDLFRDAKQVQVVARFFNNIIMEPGCAKAIEEFFSKEGKLEVVIPSPGSNEVLEVLARQRQPDGMPSESMASRIQHSVAQLEQCRVRAGKAGEGLPEIIVCDRCEVLNYAGFRFDEQLVFGAYEHHFRNSVGVPLFHFDLRRNEKLREFWDEEFSYLSQPRTNPVQEVSPASAFVEKW